MPAWICATCANQHGDTPDPPVLCDICADERQWVPPSGQRWTTLEQLSSEGYRSEVREVEAGLLGIGVSPALGIGQRALVVQSPAGNVLWDPPGYLDDTAIRAVREIGGLAAVSASHPHFYGAIVEWSHAFGAPILIAEADREWLLRTDPAVELWSGTLEVLPGLTLVQCGGHFDGSAVLHWASGAEGRGALLVGDTVLVTPGEDRVTFVRSAPNRLPLPQSEVRRVVEALEPWSYDRIYGGWWKPAIHEGAQSVVERSAARYCEWVTGEAVGV